MLGKNCYKEYYDCVKDIIEDPIVLEMKNYIHHGDTTCYQHCVNVSYYNYRVCKALKLDAKSAARAGLLHDLFLYDWHKHRPESFQQLHGFTHPMSAWMNAKKFFKLNSKEDDIIIKHMWPLTFTLPLFKESYVISLVDKYCGILEIADYQIKTLPEKIRTIKSILKAYKF